MSSSSCVHPSDLLVKHLFNLQSGFNLANCNDLLGTSIRNFIRYRRKWGKIIDSFVLWVFYIQISGISLIEASYEYVCVCVCLFSCSFKQREEYKRVNFILQIFAKLTIYFGS